MVDTNEFLEHYGVKGMKWGIRNKSKRSKKGGKEVKVKAKRKKALKNRRTMSDQDIQKFIDRLNQEKKLKTLINEDLKPGKTIAKRIVSDSGQKVARTVLAGAGVYATKAILERKIDPREAAPYLAPKPKKK